MKLLVVIPTWNRADYLDTAIRAIAMARSIARTCEVELFVSDNCSSDHTQEVVLRWQAEAPWIHYRRWEEHISTSWPAILRRAFLGSNLGYDYLWLQGDDDYISEPSAYDILAEAVKACADDPPAIVHCCQTRRSLPGDERVIAGTTEELCNIYGWHDLLGWISGLAISHDTVDRMWASPHCEIQPASAYWHSEVLLEAAYGRTMLVLAKGLIDPQDQEQTAESVQRWSIGGGAGTTYWRIIPGLLSLKDRGVITTPLTLTFFRYLTYSFWDRFAVQVMSQASSSRTTDEYLDEKLDLLNQLAMLLGQGEDRKLYVNWLQGFRDDIARIRRALRLIENRIEMANRPSYSWTLLPTNEIEGRE
jgi:glycosyltransferase involved in cell wall biosynthesis